MPLVGELGLSVAFASRACEDDIDNVRLRPDASPSVVDDVFSDIGEAFCCTSSSAMSDLRSGLLLVDVRSAENLLVE